MSHLQERQAGVEIGGHGGDSVLPGQMARNGMAEDLDEHAAPDHPMPGMESATGDRSVGTSPGAASGQPAVAEPVPATPAPAPSPVSVGRRGRWWRFAGLAVALTAIAAGGWWARPLLAEWVSTEWTDDAYVNSHVTLVAPRVAGQVTRVLVDDNDRVRKGDLLVELDREPYQAQVELKRAGVNVAKADLRAAESEVRGALALARAQRWKLQSSIEGVDNQVADLRSQVAALRSKEATRDLAKVELSRTEQLHRRNAASREQLDQDTAALKVAEAQVRQAVEEVREARAALGQPPDPPAGRSLADVPADLNQTFSLVRQALADLIQTTAQVGLPLSSSEATPLEFLTEFRKLDVEGNIDQIFARLVPDAPAVKLAQSKLDQTQRALELAELDLQYCEVRAEVDGVVARRTVNPGNHVVAGQQMMSVRSLTEVWVDCHFKETQLAGIRIGHPVDLRVDAYPGLVFRGRVSGFAPGTGASLAILPPENATGNFVKIVQRLTVRVELSRPNPPDTPLFAGLSVVPVVRVRETPTGPDAGARLRSTGDDHAVREGQHETR